MKPRFEIGDRVIYKPQNYVGTICGLCQCSNIYTILCDDDGNRYSVLEEDIEFENPNMAFLTRLQELLASFDAKICSWAEGCDTSGIDVYFGEQCVIAFPINRTTECTTITAENVFDYDKD